MAYQVCITQKSRRIFLRLCHIILYYMHPERNYIHYLRNPSEYSCFLNYCCGRHVCDYLSPLRTLLDTAALDSTP
jgi:hypothetical protein